MERKKPSKNRRRIGFVAVIASIVVCVAVPDPAVIAATITATSGIIIAL